MADQLRWDYLSCYGHPTLKTPNIDKLASKGTLFNSAYVQSPVCGPSRASIYTGRTVFSHGSTWNQVPLPIGEYTVGDYLRPYGVKCAVVGKTHMKPDLTGMKRLGISKKENIGLIISEPGFDPYERDDGLHPKEVLKKRKKPLNYNQFLNKNGYEGTNPWETWANSTESKNGKILSGWHLRNSNKPARVSEEHSETAYMTNKAIEFISENKNNSWMLHLSYIKPHWPYIAPSPYHNLYGPNSFIPVHRSDNELQNIHPVYKEFTRMNVSKSFSKNKVRETVLSGYMGLIKQIDDHLGRLFDYLEKEDLFKNTMIVFTSDHGDYLGDHWLGEKELFHEASVRVPLIIYDPSEKANQSRNKKINSFVEGIDLLPTFIDFINIDAEMHRLEGFSLLPFLREGKSKNIRKFVFSEIDYGFSKVRERLSLKPEDARAYMIRTNSWKYIYYKGFAPQLFDLKNDKDEFFDLGRSKKHSNIIARMKDLLISKLTDRKNRITVTDKEVLDRPQSLLKSGIKIGVW